MMMHSLNVIILAGGQGTRLKSVWQGPKCLVPVAGKPVLDHILDKIAPLGGNIILALNHGYKEVRDHMMKAGYIFSYVQDKKNVRGTLDVVLNCMEKAPKASRTLILNGDTIPEYDLNGLLIAQDRAGATQMVGVVGDTMLGSALIVGDPDESWGNSPFAGFWDTVYHDPNTQFYVPKLFLDVGTPEGLAEARIIKGEKKSDTH